MSEPEPDVAGRSDDPAAELLRPGSARVEFRCDRCGAAVTWDPDADALRCDHCEHVQPVPRAEGTVLERPLEAAEEAARGLGLDLRVAQCGNCGARIAYGEASVAEACVFCGSAQVLQQSANRNALRPESLIPLDVGRAAVEDGFRRWLKRLWFRPGELRAVDPAAAVGIYVPYWTFDCRVQSDWSADAGYYYYVTVPRPTMVRGKLTVRMVRERRIRWEPAWGTRHDVFDDLHVAASRGLSEDLLRQLGPFDTRALLPYRPEYLAGWRAEEYQVDLLGGWKVGQERVEEEQLRRCAGDVPGDTQRNLRVHNLIADVRWKHVLLPIWSLTYAWRGKSYRVLVHGQSARVVGQAPYSWIKILLVVGALAAGVGTAFVALNA